LTLLLLVLYAAAGIAYGVHFARRNPGAGRLATTLLLVGALLHTFVIGMETMEVRHVPFANPSRAISTFVWLLALSYLYLELSTGERAMGVFILPVAVGLQTIPVLYPGVEIRDPILESPWFWIHVSSLLFAYASFAIGCVLGLTYMLQFKEIKKKHLGFFYTRLPALHVLDAMNARAMAIGWIFLTIGVAVGVVWTAQARAVAPDDPMLQAIGLNDPKVFIAVLTWLLYTFALVARRAMGWTGRRAAWMSAFGFVIVLLNFVPVSYFVTTSHSFQ
jgi:ABC-type transport system involved in cytochrome c biogenesis permease subunit